VRIVALLALALPLGCSTDYVEGRYSCTMDLPDNCPPGWYCHASDHRCWSTPEGADADADADADVDADADADADVATDELDVPVDTSDTSDAVDGDVPCTADSCDDGNACNGLETCGTDGVCAPGTAAIDYTECTTAEGTPGGCFSGTCELTLAETAIPAGTYSRGSSAGGPGEPDFPMHEVTITVPFRIDRYEVTNARYAACVAAGVCRAQGSRDSNTRSDYDTLPAYAAFPVLHVSWDDAVDFCGWLGRRLPSEAEWEMAARGAADERAYPWGDLEPDCDHANFTDATTGIPCVTDGDTDAVGARPLGASPYGVHDLAGNVAEWVSDFYQPDTYATDCATGCVDPTGPADGPDRVVRGGSWDGDADAVRVSERSYAAPNTRDEFTGFRCARAEP
jgi:formylglycine-generating enzyme required for sulfatase activity